MKNGAFRRRQKILQSLFSLLAVALAVLSAAFAVPLSAAFIASFWKRYISGKLRAALVIALLSVAFGLDSWYWQNCLIDIVFFALRCGLILYFLRKLCGNNVPAYVCATIEVYATMYLTDLIGHAGKIAMGEIITAAILLLAPAVVAMSCWRRDVSVLARKAESAQ